MNRAKSLARIADASARVRRSLELEVAFLEAQLDTLHEKKIDLLKAMLDGPPGSAALVKQLLRALVETDRRRAHVTSTLAALRAAVIEAHRQTRHAEKVRDREVAARDRERERRGLLDAVLHFGSKGTDTSSPQAVADTVVTVPLENSRVDLDHFRPSARRRSCR